MNKRLLEALGGLGELLNKVQRNEGKEVGAISPDLLKKYKKYNRDKQLLKDECEIEQRRLTLEVKRRMEEMFQDRIDEIEENNEALWREIEAELGLTTKDELSIDPKTGVVTRYVNEDEEEPVFNFKH